MGFRSLFTSSSPKAKANDTTISPQISRGSFASLIRKKDKSLGSSDNLADTSTASSNVKLEGASVSDSASELPSGYPDAHPTSPAASDGTDQHQIFISPKTLLVDEESVSALSSGQVSRSGTPGPDETRNSNSSLNIDKLNVKDDHDYSSVAPQTGQSSTSTNIFSDASAPDSAPTSIYKAKINNAPVSHSPLGMQIVQDAIDDHETDSDHFHSAHETVKNTSVSYPKAEEKSEKSEKSEKLAKVDRKSDGEDSSSVSPPTSLEISGYSKKNKRHSSLSLRRFFDKVKNHHHHHHHHSHHGHHHSSHSSPGAGADKASHTSIEEDSQLYQKYGAIGKHLGTGASGSVNLVTSPSNNQVYAVKKFSAKLPGESDHDFKIRVKNEFKIGEKLKHPNLVHTFELLKDYPGVSGGNHDSKHIKMAKLASDPQFYMVMEYCPYDFFNLVMSGLITTKELFCYFKQIVSGVHYMHEQGLAHRDLKLDNCVVNEEGVLKIIDYGSAVSFRKELGHNTHINTTVDEILDEKYKLVRARGVVGSDPYLAPEVLEPSNFGYDPRCADVWSCAVIFCCMVLRRFPWKLPKLSDPSYRSFVGISDEEARQIEQNPIGFTADHHYNKDGNNGSSSSTSRGSGRLLRHLPSISRKLIANMLEIDPKSRYLTSAVIEDPFFKGIECCQPKHPASNHTHHLVTEEELEKIQKEEQREKAIKKAEMH